MASLDPCRSATILLASVPVVRDEVPLNLGYEVSGSTLGAAWRRTERLEKFGA